MKAANTLHWGIDMELYIYSAKNNSFFPKDYVIKFEQCGWDLGDAVDVDHQLFIEYTGDAPAGKVRVAGADGMPAWGDIPPLSHEEKVALAESHKLALIDQANSYMNGKQWPGKAAIGRLKGDELAQYNLWLDYLDALETVNTFVTAEIIWPEAPTM